MVSFKQEHSAGMMCFKRLFNKDFVDVSAGFISGTFPVLFAEPPRDVQTEATQLSFDATRVGPPQNVF